MRVMRCDCGFEATGDGDDELVTRAQIHEGEGHRMQLSAELAAAGQKPRRSAPAASPVGARRAGRSPDHLDRMIGLVGRRVVWSGAVLLVASMGAVRGREDHDGSALRRQGWHPGDPTASVPESTAALIESEEKRLELDRPLPEQYASWLSHFVRGDRGESIVSRRSVGAEIRQRLWNTTQFVVWAILLSLAIAVLVGVVCASRPDSALDHLISGLPILALSMPAFWFALVSIERLEFRPRYQAPRRLLQTLPKVQAFNG